jgi:hypothetical protein
MWLCASVFDACMLRIDISSWWIFPLNNMNWPSLSLRIDFSLKSALSDMSMATSACLWGPFVWEMFFPAFDAKPVFIYFFFSVKWVSCKQHMVGSCF